MDVQRTNASTKKQRANQYGRQDATEAKAESGGSITLHGREYPYAKEAVKPGPGMGTATISCSHTCFAEVVVEGTETGRERRPAPTVTRCH